MRFREDGGAAGSGGDGAQVIAATYARWDGYQMFNERDVFGTTEPGAIVEAVDRFCRAELGSGVDHYEFYATSVCGVHGVRLKDGRGAVVKVHRAAADTAHLDAVHAVQRHLVAAGFPAPAPVLGPAPLAGGIAVVDELLSHEGREDAHEPAVRRAVAAGLARQIGICRELGAVPGLKTAALVRRQLWAQPHDRRFDFVASAAGAGWIDELAAEARRRLDDVAGAAPVAGHNDWRVEHLRFGDGKLSATWDWDSLSLAPEPVVVGSAAHTFVADYSVDGLECVPTLDESLAFIGDYEAARGAAFSADELRILRASLVAAVAYGARCEHSDRLTTWGTRPPVPPPAAVPPGGFCAYLAENGPRLLGVEFPAVRPVAPSSLHREEAAL
jgi:hypothetical protein